MVYDHECPTCLAEPGHECEPVSRLDSFRTAHSARFRVDNETRAAAMQAQAPKEPWTQLTIGDIECSTSTS